MEKYRRQKQRIVFVHKQVERYLRENEEMTIPEALEQLYLTRVAPLSLRMKY